ncbi:hypothetical protein CkaCkLH20_01342 [Colletotrichum karsti]|uniref:SAC3/GANP/THP3 conserved domain-containing protein n=1 Tax=Colletotrichum karsti TaxID=1095194 RepID=A0A9P6LQU1_9PEZI|nr:uncharacterized protein CkaCkLH20_01342 [Colletotrichum karsti]KAF9881192.1 hypothetical protein CkaCkLH20_01342 [Colletotrichum karsti]
MTSVSYPPSRPGSTKSPFGGSSSGGFGGHSDEVYNGLGLDGAGGGGKRSKRILKTQPLEMTTLSTKRKGTNPFDGASSDDNRRRKNTKSNGQGDWKKKGAQTSVARSNGAKRGAKGFGTSQSRRGFGSQNTDNHQGTESPEYETDDANGDAAGDGTPYSDKILAQLRKEGIAPPKWPSDPGNTKQKAAMAKFREDYKTYRDRARTSLMRAGLIDDPDKPKRLEDAIDFKGICDGMCPDFEKITRITEFDVQSAEKDSRTFAITSKMVKKLARSAAGQEAPLPMDVRSTAALRKTLDYLIDELLQTDENLPTMHGFLWDRTRAIRRDFIFHSTMAPEEMKDQVYCLETIARFHVISLHLLSQEGLTPEDFSEQQEIEQLGKSLLSLMFAYDDCKPHGVICENEAEFRAYHLLFSANKPNILDDVQKEWGDSRFWTESDEIRTAVSLVESLQNTDDFHGPLAQNSSAATLSNAEQPKSTPAQTPFNGLATAPTQPPVKPPSSGLPSTQSPLPSFNFQANNVPPTNPAPSTQPFPAPATTTTPATGLGFTPAPPPKPPVAERRPPQDVMGDFAKWFVTGDNGLIHEFEKYIVEQIVSDAFEQYHREEEERKRKEEEEKALAEARAFQVHNLSLKYFYRWRTIARNLRLSKIRRQQREEFRIAQAEMREEEIKRKKKAARVAEARRRALEEHGVDPVEELREILQLKKGDEPQEDLQAEAEALFATGILSGVTNERAAIANVIQAPSFATPPPPSRSTNSLSQSVSAKPCGAKTRALREEFSSSSRSFRRSLPPMSAHSSSSRFTPSESPQKRVSKVSDRWRLKAMGLVTMPDGSALPESIANEMLYNGKRYSGLGSFGLDGTERRSRSVSADLNHAAEARQRFSQSLNGTTSTQAANGISPLSKRKRSRDDDKEATTADEAARVKKRPSSNADVERILREARENLESLRSSRVDLDEGAEWFREQNEMMQAEEMSRASSPWGKGRN